MGKVEFHHGIQDKMGYACRLLRKAYRAGAQVVVTGDAGALRQLDKQLWLFDDQEFLPHALGDGPSVPARLQASPIWLTTDPASAPGERGILINIGVDMPSGMDRYERLFDLVSSEPDDRQAGRQRWKAYAGMGWDVRPHEVQDEAR